MITIQATMLVMLGFLLAMLLALALAPAFRRRAERLTMERVRQSMPMTEAEIIADKDRLRAQFAIRVHKLEQELDKFRLAAARHIVDINRRDATVASLESEVERFKADQEENVNARRVLEHTISDRVPKIEQRLSEARKLLEQRDHEMAALSSEATRGIRARDEAMQANLQQRGEIDRLKATLGTRPRERFPTDGAREDSIREDAQSAAERLASENRIATLKAKVDDQTTEISRLKASLEAYESGKEGASRSGKIVSKSRIQALEAEVKSQADTIQRLRTDLAASNERAARQAGQYVEEMRRLRTGPPAQSTPAKGASGAPKRRTLAERVMQAHTGPAPAAAGPREPADNGVGSSQASAGDNGKVTEFLKALAEPVPDASRPETEAGDSSPPAEGQAVKVKPRLMDRLTGAGKG